MRTLSKHPSVSKKRSVEILLVEDNSADIRLIQETLKSSKFHISLSVAGDGEQAIEFLRRQGSHGSAPKPDFVLLDLNMPRKSGHEVVAEIRRWPRLNSIPVLILTSSDHDDDKWKAYESHVDAYLLKPRELAHYAHLLKYLEETWIKNIPLDHAS